MNSRLNKKYQMLSITLSPDWASMHSGVLEYVTPYDGHEIELRGGN